MKREDPLSNGGSVLFVLGALAFVPPLFDYQLAITAWLGGMQQPLGLSAMVVGGVLFGVGKLRELRNAAPGISPTDPAAIAAAEADARAAAGADLASHDAAPAPPDRSIG